MDPLWRLAAPIILLTAALLVPTPASPTSLETMPTETPSAPGGTGRPDHVHLTHDHLTQPPDRASFELPDNMPRSELTLEISPREPRQPCLDVHARLTVTAPDGRQLTLGSGQALGSGHAGCGRLAVLQLDPAPGRWMVAFEGRGLATSTVSLVPLDAQ